MTARPIPHAMTTTALTLDGYRSTKSLGVVRGVTVRSRSRAEAFELLLEHAQELGANAVVGIRYDATEVMTGVTEVLCYGTAVVMAPA